MSSLSNLLRNSRVSQLPKTKNKQLVPSGDKNFYPTHQIIETKPALLYRNEWGLKSTIPSKKGSFDYDSSNTAKNSRYLVFNELDTLERITSFEKIGSSQYNRLRFKEMNLHPSYNPGVVNPLFSSNSKSNDSSAPLSSLLKFQSGSNNNSKINKLKEIRPYLKEWVLKNDPQSLKYKKFNLKEMSENAITFLESKINSNHRKGQKKYTLNKDSMKHVIGTGGLTYNLKGKLRNSPNGIVQKTIVPGRFVNVDGFDRLAAIGGFISNASSSSSMNSQAIYNMGDFIRQQKFPFELQHASVQGNGKVVIKSKIVNDYLNQMNKNKINLASRTYEQNPNKFNSNRKRNSSTNNADSVKQAEELLQILTKFE